MPFGSRRALSLFAALALSLLANSARADGRAEFEKARASFLARNWAEAEERLRVLLDPKTDLKERPLIAQSRMYLGAALLSQGKRDEAKQVFEKLVLDDPSFEPDPLSVPGDAINAYIDVRSSLLEEIRKASQAAARLEAERKKREEAEREAQRVWLESLKAQASEETITVRHSRWVASLPFGIGQFQNGQPILGWSFLGAEVAALAGTAVTYGMFRYARGRENQELPLSCSGPNDCTGINGFATQWHNRAEDIRLVNLGFVGGFAVTAAIGIVQANLAFVSEKPETRKRELPKLGGPPAAKLTPIVAPLPGGALIGVQGVSF